MINLQNTFPLFSKKLMNAMFIMPLVFLMLFVSNVWAGGNDTLAANVDENVHVAEKPKDFEIALQPALLSDNSTSQIRAGLIYDCTTNTIVWEKDLKYAYPIASLTKMMVALIAIEEIKCGTVDWQDQVSVTKTYRKSKRSKRTYTVNETYSLESLLKMAMIPSNNEACGLIGKHISGSVETFVTRMNQKAAALGMTQTFYSNPSGLPAGYGSLDNSSSPYDLLKLSTELIKYPELLSITNIAFAEVENGHGSNVYRNHNHLVMDYPGEVDGLKTGYTKNAKFCLVATAKKNDHRLIAIALGASNPWLRNQIVGEMLNNYYTQLGFGPMGNQKVDPLFAKADRKTVNDIASSNVPVMNQEIVYKTVTSIQKRAHIVKSGQTLSDIADKYNCSVNELKKWNGLKSSRILKDQRLYVRVHVKKQIPVSTKVIDNYDECEDNAEDCAPQNVADKQETPKQEQLPTSQSKPTLKVIYHEVQPGDTLWKIAQQYPGTSVDQLKRINKISNSKDLKAGSKIKVSVKG
jgi:D-alanyl-D-alanine carboxypeptidase (penicillin-binding protein 5/6)